MASSAALNTIVQSRCQRWRQYNFGLKTQAFGFTGRAMGLAPFADHEASHSWFASSHRPGRSASAQPYRGMPIAAKRSMKYVMGIALLVILLAGCRTNETPEQQVNDAEITANLKAKLASDLGVASITNISVNSTQGIVTLAGTVHSAAEKSKAVAIAQSIPKVVRVNDNLQIAATP